MLESLFNNFAGPQACNCMKKDSSSCFPVKFANFSRAPLFTEHLQWVLLKIAVSILLAKSLQNTHEGVYFFVNLQAVGIPSQVFSKEFAKILR